MRLTFWTAFWVFLVDQFTKYIVVHALDLVNRLQIDVLPPLLTFRMAWNRGVNFGLFSGLDMRWVLIAVAVVISGIVLYWVHRDPGSRWTQLSAGLLVGGAAGNVVDRVLYGAVADFLNMSCCGFENPYAFNVADISIFAGAIGLVIFTGDTGGGKSGGKSGGTGGGLRKAGSGPRAKARGSMGAGAGGKASGTAGDKAPNKGVDKAAPRSPLATATRSRKASARDAKGSLPRDPGGR